MCFILWSQSCFIDIEMNTYNLDIEKLEKKLFFTKKNKKLLPKVVVPVVFSGNSITWKDLRDFQLNINFSF